MPKTTFWKLLQRKTGLNLPFTRETTRDGKISTLTPLENKHKSRDTVTGFAWVHPRRRSSMGTKRSRRMRKSASHRSLASQKSTHPTHPFLRPPSLRPRHSRSSDFRLSGQVLEIPPDLNDAQSYPFSPVWGLDGIIRQAPRSLTHPPSPIYGLDGIMESHAATDRSPPSRGVTFTFTSPRPLDQVLHDAQMESAAAPVENDEAVGQVDGAVMDNEPLVEAISTGQPLSPFRRGLLRLSIKRKEKHKAPVEDEGTKIDVESTQLPAPTMPTQPQADILPLPLPAPADQDTVEHTLDGHNVQGEEAQATPRVASETRSQGHSDVSKEMPFAEANETIQRISTWLLEVSEATSLRGSSFSSITSNSLERPPTTRSSNHRRFPANHSPCPPSPPHFRVSVADDNGTLHSHDDHSRASCIAQVNYSGSASDLNVSPPTVAAYPKSESISSSSSTLRSNTSFKFDDKKRRRGGHTRTITPATSHGSPSPSTHTPAPWDLDPTKSTITRAGDVWSSMHSKPKHTSRKPSRSREIAWERQWAKQGKSKIYWTNYQAPTTFDSHWRASTLR